MKFQVIDIEFDFSSDDPTWGDIDPDYQQEVTEETISQIWDAEDEDDLLEEITCATGWCVSRIDYVHVLS